MKPPDPVSAVVCTPHGSRYQIPYEDRSAAELEAAKRYWVWLEQQPRQMSRLCGGDGEECGRHSGIPACCRGWWRDVWLRSVVLFGNRFWPAWWYDEWRYIACPGCRQCGARIHLQPCPPRNPRRSRIRVQQRTPEQLDLFED